MNKRLFLFWGALVGLVALVTGGYLVWKNFLAYDEVKLYEKITKDYVEAMTADTYGGKTPQETLDLFVVALRAGDVELASKYFALNIDSNSEYYLARTESEEPLKRIKNEGRLNEIADIVTIATPDLENRLDENDYKFISRDRSGKLQAYINLQFNAFSQVWKIESL